MFSNFELSFDYREGYVQFALLRHGITMASRQRSWDEIEPLLRRALDDSAEFDQSGDNEDGVLDAWMVLIERVLGEDACQVIVGEVPASLTIAVEKSVPPSYYDLFRVAPFEIAIARIGGLADEFEIEHALHDRQITVVDVRIVDEESEEEFSVAGIDQVPASMDFYSEKEDEDATGTLFPVWFGTNRKLFAKNGDVFEHYEQMEEDSIHLGKCEVWIPKSRRRGELKSPFYNPLRWHIDDALRFNSITLVGDVVESIRQTIQVDPQSNHLLFIHGFNSSLADAILRAAQIGFDLGINGATMAFSWPSRKLIPFISRYTGDGEFISGSRLALQRMASEIRGLEGTLHIIAHSMGNRALTQGWRNIVETIKQSDSLEIGQIIFAAPDVFQQAFRDDTASIHEFCRRATLYANRLDYALGISRCLTQTPRAGSIPPVMRLKQIDTVEVPFNIALLGHTYFAKLIPMLEDLAALIEENSAPGGGSRNALECIDEGLRHWCLRTAKVE